MSTIKTTILGLSGSKESGKTTVAAAVEDWFKSYASELYEPMDWDRLLECCTISFADPLKKILIDVMGLSKDQCYGTNDDKNTLTDFWWDSLPIEIRLKYSNENIVLDNQIHKLPRIGQMTSREVMQVLGTDIMRDMFDNKIWVSAALRQIRRLKEGSLVLIPDVRFKSEVYAILDHPNGYIVRLLRKPHNDSHPSETQLDDFCFNDYSNRCIEIDNQELGIKSTNTMVINFLKDKIG